MSSIGEARQHIAAGSEVAGEAKMALGSAKDAIGQAIDIFGQAVEGSGHARVEAVLGAYRSAMADFEEAITRLDSGQNDADSYSASLG